MTGSQASVAGPAAPASPEQLCAAARRGDVDALAAMLDAGADCNGRRAVDGMTALHEAAAAGALAAAQLLLERGARVAAALQVAVDNEHFDWQPLHFAAAGGHAPLVELLLARGADVDADGFNRRTPFLEAAWCGHTGAVRAFLDAGVCMYAQYDGKGRHALHLTAWEAHADCVALLLERGAEVQGVTCDDLTALHWLSSNMHSPIDIVKQILHALLAAGADVNAMDSSGRAPLHIAAKCSGSRVQALLAAGADVEAATHGSAQRPLHVASDHANLGGVEALLAAGASVHARNSDGATALHRACASCAVCGKTSLVIAALLAAGADASAADKDGWQPLHYLAACTPFAGLDLERYEAYEARAAEAVAALLAAGGNMSAAGNNGTTPLMMAVQNGKESRPVLMALARHRAAPVDGRASSADAAAGERLGLQGLIVGAATEAARLRREQASLREECAAWEGERTALEQERTAWQQQQVAWQEERAALEAARVAFVAAHKQAVAASSAQQVVGPAAKRPRSSA